MARRLRHHDELFAPTTAGACEVGNEEHPFATQATKESDRANSRQGANPKQIVKSLMVCES
jgi:hypothetical protein